MCRSERDPDGPRHCSSHARTKLGELTSVVHVLRDEQREVDAALRGSNASDHEAQRKLNRILGLGRTPQQRSDVHRQTAQKARDAADRWTTTARQLLTDGDPYGAETAVNRAASLLRQADYYTSRAEEALSAQPR